MKASGRHSPDRSLILGPNAQIVKFRARQMLHQRDGQTVHAVCYIRYFGFEADFL